VKSMPAERQEQDAIDLCSETIQRLHEIPGISGVHIIASGWDDFIPEVLTRAGIGKREDLDTPTQSADDAAVTAAAKARTRSGGRKVAD